MNISPRAGRPATKDDLTSIPDLIAAYHAKRPDPRDDKQRVSFGTSGHRGSSLTGSFNEWHILAVTQAICEHRTRAGIDGPLFLGRDTHALSEPAFETALRVLASNGVAVMVDRDGGPTPTPAISLAILTYPARAGCRKADGIVITPSHNPPEDGGFKYNPPEGGPAPTEVTKAIQKRANEILVGDVREARRTATYAEARDASTTKAYDYMGSYVGELDSVLDMELLRRSKIRIGVHPLGGAGVRYWRAIRERYDLNLDIVSEEIDPSFEFMTLDWDGKIRMDCSSKYAMAQLIDLRDRYAVAFGNDTDYDRHGIVTPVAGLMNPNHYLAVAVSYLFQNRPGWSRECKVGKTVVTSSMVDAVAGRGGLGRELYEVPVGFKWFVEGLLGKWLGFGGEESAGACFLRKDGTVWVTEKDGIILGLLAAEMKARTGKDPAELYDELTRKHGPRFYERTDAPATDEQKKAFENLKAEDVRSEISTFVGDKEFEVRDTAPGNKAPFGGVKVIAKGGWFAARPSGTEPLYKIYAESLESEEHLRKIQGQAREIMERVFAKAVSQT